MSTYKDILSAMMDLIIEEGTSRSELYDYIDRAHSLHMFCFGEDVFAEFNGENLSKSLRDLSPQSRENLQIVMMQYWKEIAFRANLTEEEIMNRARTNSEIIESN